MSAISGALILEQLREINLPRSSRQANANEKRIAEKIVDLLKKLETCIDFDIKDTEELFVIESEEDINADITYVPLDGGESNEIFEYDYVKKVIDYKYANPKHSFSTLQNRFPRVKYSAYLSRFKNYLEYCGTSREKFLQISQFVWQSYRLARDSYAAVHDKDLKRWALQKAREVGLQGFKASDSWIKTFKRKHHIGNRRVTKFITFTQERKQNEIFTEACEFQKDFLEKIKPKFSPQSIMNTDQTGFNYEVHRDRTLSDIGERSTLVRSINQRAISHSYTVQPMINMAGKLAPNFMIVFQEPSGSFGPNVLANLKKPDHIFVTCSKSGKVESSILKEWTEKCLAPLIGPKACLLIDSFSSHRNSNLFSVPGKEITVKLFPPGSTPLLQPLDVLIFRQWKIFVKNFSERVLLDGLNIDLHNRNVIIALHSIIHDQLRAPLFKPLILNAWARAGYPIEKTFYNTFTDSIFDESGSKCKNCTKESFILCAWCKEHLCIEHILIHNLHGLVIT